MTYRRLAYFCHLYPIVRKRVHTRLRRVNDHLYDADCDQFVYFYFCQRHASVFRVQGGLFMGLLRYDAFRHVIFAILFQDRAWEREFHVQVGCMKHDVRVVRVMVDGYARGLYLHFVLLVLFSDDDFDAFRLVRRGVSAIGNDMYRTPNRHVFYVYFTRVGLVDVNRDGRIQIEVCGVFSAIVGRRVNFSSRRKVQHVVFCQAVRTWCDYFRAVYVVVGVSQLGMRE